LVWAHILLETTWKQARNESERLLHINQIKYLKEILKCFRMEDRTPIGIPFDPKVKLQRNMDGNDESKGFPYQQMVGSLTYAMLCTRLDLAYQISVLTQHMANPNMEHWMAVKGIFWYLQGILQMNSNFGGTPSKEVLGYCDATRVVIFKIRSSPEGLFSWSEVEPFLGVANDNLQ
jgi:hypothetical protein